MTEVTISTKLEVIASVEANSPTTLLKALALNVRMYVSLGFLVVQC